ncbi:7973_t:CDS:1, partial [Gigaspora rosea]
IKDGESYFYQQLLMNVPARNEDNNKTNLTGSYREKYLLIFPNALSDLQNQETEIYHSRISNLNTQFTVMLDRLLYTLNYQLPTDLYYIIQTQLENLKILPNIVPPTATLELPQANTMLYQPYSCT